MNLLYIFPGPVPPEGNSVKDKFFHLSRELSGDILLPVWNRVSRYRHLQNADQFTYHFTYCFHLPGPIRFVWELCFFVGTGLWLHYTKKPFDFVIPYGTNRTGIAAYLLSRLTGARLVLEIPGTPAKAFVLGDSHPSVKDRLKRSISLWLLRRLHNASAGIKLIYPAQLDGVHGLDERIPHFLIHSFVPIHFIQPSDVDEKFILLMGHPLFLKGADILIKAFVIIADNFPDHRLVIVGHCPNLAPFLELANGHPRIEFRKAIFHNEAIELIQKCSVYVVASRTEGFPRVLYEAMAARKPFVATAVDGIPYYVRHAENGLLCKAEDPRDLAAQLTRILENPEFAQQLATRGRKFAEAQLSEDLYVKKFVSMLREVSSRQATGAR